MKKATINVMMGLLWLANPVGGAVATWAAETDSQQPAAKKWALLIGVDSYSDAGLNKLSYCGADAISLRDLLVREVGFSGQRVWVMHDGAEEGLRPKRRTILTHLAEMLDQAGAEDLVLVAFSGHGVEINEKAYLCPLDGDPHAAEDTMLGIDEMYRLLKTRCRATKKLVLIDACRSNLGEGRGIVVEPVKMSERFARAINNIPTGLCLLSSCTSGQSSLEDDKLKHGIFMYYLMDGLKGEADRRSGGGNGDGRVDAEELFHYAAQRTRNYVRTERHGQQSPEKHSLVTEDIYLSEPQFAPEVNNSVGMKFAMIPRGRFLMGSPPDNGHENERPQHEVFITDPFYLAVTEVTQSQYEKVMDKNGSYFSASGGGKRRVQDTADLPVDSVSFDDAREFCRRLSRTEGLPENAYRLPTEAEWEYAARAGATEEFGPAGNGIALEAFAWFDGTANERSHPVGKLRPNAFGLYDMLGNVAEWCGDWYDPRYYPRSPAEDPPGPTQPHAESWKLLRGGCWCFSKALCRVADRYAIPKDHQVNYAGFRVLRAVLPSHDRLPAGQADR